MKRFVMGRGRIAIFGVVIAAILLVPTWIYTVWLPQTSPFLPNEDRHVLSGPASVLRQPSSIATLAQSPIREIKPIVSGPSASWADILSAANNEAKKIDKDASFGWQRIHAYPADSFIEDEWAYTNTLEIWFTYLSPSGNEINIFVQDTAPASTISTSIDGTHRDVRKTSYGSNRQPESSEISPRQAVERTWMEAQDYGQKQGLANMRIRPTFMYLDESGWSVKYNMWDTSPITPDLNTKGNYLVASFGVDGQTGEITSHEFTDMRKMPNVVP